MVCPQSWRGVAEARLTAEEKKKKRQKKNSKETAQNGTREDDAGSVAARHKSLLEKKEKALKKKRQEDEERPDDAQPEQVPTEAEAAVQEPHGLDPLPQPEPVAKDLSEPSYETLPPWLVSPIRVSPETSAPFSEFGLSPRAWNPGSCGEEALQAPRMAGSIRRASHRNPAAAALPRAAGRLGHIGGHGLRKDSRLRPAHGRDISRFTAPKLRGLVVVPTRELVQQVQAVCEACARALLLAWRGRREQASPNRHRHGQPVAQERAGGPRGRRAVLRPGRLRSVYAESKEMAVCRERGRGSGPRPPGRNDEASALPCCPAHSSRGHPHLHSRKARGTHQLHAGVSRSTSCAGWSWTRRTSF